MRVPRERISSTLENFKGSVAKVSRRNIYGSPQVLCVSVNYEEIFVEWTWKLWRRIFECCEYLRVTLFYKLSASGGVLAAAHVFTWSSRLKCKLDWNWSAKPMYYQKVAKKALALLWRIAMWRGKLSHRLVTWLCRLAYQCVV